mgnify:CR=1 FL=1
MVVGSMVMVNCVPAERDPRENSGGGVTIHVPRVVFDSLDAKRISASVNVPFVLSTAATVPVMRRVEATPALARISDDAFSLDLFRIAVAAIAATMSPTLTAI